MSTAASDTGSHHFQRALVSRFSSDTASVEPVSHFSADTDSLPSSRAGTSSVNGRHYFLHPETGQRIRKGEFVDRIVQAGDRQVEHLAEATYELKESLEHGIGSRIDSLEISMTSRMDSLEALLRGFIAELRAKEQM